MHDFIKNRYVDTSLIFLRERRLFPSWVALDFINLYKRETREASTRRSRMSSNLLHTIIIIILYIVFPHHILPYYSYLRPGACFAFFFERPRRWHFIMPEGASWLSLRRCVIRFARNVGPTRAENNFTLLLFLPQSALYCWCLRYMFIRCGVFFSFFFFVSFFYLLLYRCFSFISTTN